MAPIAYEYDVVLSDGTTLKGEGRYLISAICNGRFFGKGLQPAPSAVLNDQIFEFNQIDNISIFRLAVLLPKYNDGTHVKDVKESHNHKVVSGTIIPKNGPFLGNIDGEIYSFDKIEFSLHQKKLNLMYLND